MQAGEGALPQTDREAAPLVDPAPATMEKAWAEVAEAQAERKLREWRQRMCIPIVINLNLKTNRPVRRSFPAPCRLWYALLTCSAPQPERSHACERFQNCACIVIPRLDPLAHELVDVVPRESTIAAFIFRVLPVAQSS
jgi:hypothetical protein